MLIGPLQFSAHCFSPGVLFPPLVHLNFLLLHHHIANERLVCCWHFERRQAMPFTLIAAICSDRLFLLLFCCWCFCFWCCPGMICTVCNNAFSSCATISLSFLHRSWLWADEADKCCRAFADKEFNKVICVLFTSVEEQKVQTTCLILKVFHQMLFFIFTTEHTHARTHSLQTNSSNTGRLRKQ